jgi:hypothetical protein
MSAAIFCSAEVFTLGSFCRDMLTSDRVKAEGLRKKRRVTDLDLGQGKLYCTN